MENRNPSNNRDQKLKLQECKGQKSIVAALNKLC
jgi:hypothetical protein